MENDNQPGRSNTTITLEMWEHFQRLSEEHHERQQAEIERLRGDVAMWRRAYTEASVRYHQMLDKEMLT